MTSTPEPACGLLLVTHPGIADALLAQARVLLDDPMGAVATVEVGTSTREARDRLARQLADTAGARGLLVLTDLPGATPSNMARDLAPAGCHVVSGLNLPMLLRAWNYRTRPADELAELALEGGRRALLELVP